MTWRLAAFWIGGIVLSMVVAGAGAYGWQKYTLLNKKYLTTSQQLASTSAELVQVQGDNAILVDQLTEQTARNDMFQNQISGIQQTVGALTKLSHTDSQLLEKYSKVYFLNENYIPQSLATITPQDTLDTSRTYLFLTPALPYLQNMLGDAQRENVPLLVLSSYRSFGEQTALKVSYKVTYGSGANKFSADQGYSEHQLGTAVDLTTQSIANTSLTFAQTPQYVWLTNNAFKYGFILSYPQGNTYYQYEPWHWRFVGVELATYLHDHTLNFYDLDQRFIDTYLINIF